MAIQQAQSITVAKPTVSQRSVNCIYMKVKPMTMVHVHVDNIIETVLNCMIYTYGGFQVIWFIMEWAIITWLLMMRLLESCSISNEWYMYLGCHEIARAVSWNEWHFVVLISHQRCILNLIIVLVKNKHPWRFLCLLVKQTLSSFSQRNIFNF